MTRPLLTLCLLLAGCSSYLEPAQVKAFKITPTSGWSMPGIGATVGIEPAAYESLQIGVAVARAQWSREGHVVGYVGHRIVGRDGPLWILQGDNGLTNVVPDEIRLSPDNFAGVLVDPETHRRL